MTAFLVVLAIVVYFTPATVSMIRNDPHMVALLVANFFLGVTVIGWVVILVLACRALPPRAGGTSGRLR